MRLVLLVLVVATASCGRTTPELHVREGSPLDYYERAWVDGDVMPWLKRGWKISRSTDTHFELYRAREE